MDQKLLETLVMHVSTTIINLRSQEKIKRNIEELERSNRDLDDYTYVVSHDLKAPLRTIKSFSSFLLEDLGDRLDETEKDYLNRIDAAATNMDRLIEDLLLLSRVGRKFTNVEPVDLNVLLEEIRNDQVAVIDEKKAELIVDDLPTIEVQRIWMKQLFANLVNNGLKFNKSPSPKVVVSSVTDDENYLFSVKDNGIGIDSKYHSQIFKIFERLNSTEEYKGTGAGLAISKKIVEYFGGKIWLESEPGVGSVFYFTIPKKKPIRSGSE
jgi:light-regulated signal transduction histidine kinase (bacteriophytochrome)